MSDSTKSEKTCASCKRQFVPTFAFDFYQTGDDPEVGVCERCMLRGALAPRDPVAIPDGYLHEVCRYSQKENTCIFIAIGAQGHICTKGTPVVNILAERLAAGETVAKGDHCSGSPHFMKKS